MRLPTTCPVLVRPASGGRVDVQVGLAHPVVLEGLGLAESAFVASLEGGRPVTQRQARRYARVVGVLTSAGAWDAPAPAPTGSVAVHGAGRLGMEAAAALTRNGFTVALHDAAPMAVEPIGTYDEPAGGTCAGAAAAWLAARGMAVRVDGGGAALAVSVCVAAPDPADVVPWMRDDVPHVLVACDGAAAWVSHVVVPGLTACARCRDLAITRTDPAWPSLALQLAGSRLASRRPATSHLACTVAASRVVARAAGWLARSDAGVAELVDADGGITPAPISPEPGCGCGADGPVGDELAARRAQWRAPRD